MAVGAPGWVAPPDGERMVGGGETAPDGGFK